MSEMNEKFQEMMQGVAQAAMQEQVDLHKEHVKSNIAQTEAVTDSIKSRSLIMWAWYRAIRTATVIAVMTAVPVIVWLWDWALR